MLRDSFAGNCAVALSVSDDGRHHPQSRRAAPWRCLGPGDGRTVTTEEAALLLGVSVRRAWCFRGLYLSGGPAMLAHGNRGPVAGTQCR